MDLGLALNVIVTGIIVVFLALILLILVMWAMGAIITRLTGRKKPEKQIEKSSPAPQAAVVPAPADASVQVEAGIEEEVVAVIMAAVSAMQAESGAPGAFAVKSIRRSREARPAWSVAGLQQNTRPF